MGNSAGQEARIASPGIGVGARGAEWARVVDLNSDLGEGFGIWRLGDDEAMLGLVSSANIACGFHAGDPLTIASVTRAAAERGVTVGAQVSYPDLAGFGRRFLDIAADDLRAAVIYQIGALDALARASGTRVRYLKPHGALYHAVASHRGQAEAVIDAVVAVDPSFPVVGLPGSMLLKVATERGLPVVAEAFADRAYRADGTLVPRTQASAVLTDPAEIARRVVQMVKEGTVETVDGGFHSLSPRSICVHGDTAGAVEIAAAVRRALVDALIVIRPFVP
jgi:UPF0271 protein